MPQAEYNPGDTLGEHIDQLAAAITSAFGALCQRQFTREEWAESVLRVLRTAIEVSAIEPPGDCLAAAIRAAASGEAADANALADTLAAWRDYLAGLCDSPEPTRPI